MQICFITFRSITPAQRAEQLLGRSGFSSYLRRTPRWMEQKGCGYGVQVPSSTIYSCVDLLKKAGIPYGKVYLMTDKENAEELSL